MCGLVKKDSAFAWLQSQLFVLEGWVEDLSIDPSADDALLQCVQQHKAWLKAELSALHVN